MASKATTGTLTVGGEGRVQVRPDLARINLAIITEGKTAQEALTENAARSSRVAERLKVVGIPAKGLQTSSVNLSPILETREGQEPQDRIVGYRAEDTITVVASLDLAGKILDEGVAAGANQVYGLALAVKDESDYHALALKAAVKTARADAETVAAALGAKLQAPKSVEVEDEGRPISYKAITRASESTPIEAGEIEVTARVRVVFEYRIG